MAPIERACAQHFANTMDESEPAIVVGSPLWLLDTSFAKPPSTESSSIWEFNRAGKTLRPSPDFRSRLSFARRCFRFGPAMDSVSPVYIGPKLKHEPASHFFGRDATAQSDDQRSAHGRLGRECIWSVSFGYRCRIALEMLGKDICHNIGELNQN